MRIQAGQGMYFMYSHQIEAKSWSLSCMRRLAKMGEVRTIVLGENLWMTNSNEVRRMLGRMKMFGADWSRRPIGKEYGERMSDEVFEALMQQMRCDGRINAGEVGAVVPMEEVDIWWGNAGGNEEFGDDLSGEPLKPDLVRQARTEEMVEVRKHTLYTKVPVEEAMRVTGKRPIGTRWVDINKGDAVNPKYRSRLVAKEIKKNKREDLFAATPPLEAKKALFSMAVTEGVGYRRGLRHKGMKLEFIDVRRASFHSEARRPIYVQLPGEDYEEGLCGRLNNTECLLGVGFQRGQVSPCVFYNAEHQVKIVARRPGTGHLWRGESI